jgi:hypothetical protein
MHHQELFEPLSTHDLADRVVLDIGGEGRHPEAWNLNPRTAKSFGPDRGQPIPRLICGRGERLPLADQSVDVMIVERTPLRTATLGEILRVARPGAIVYLRHFRPHQLDPHRNAVRMLPGRTERRTQSSGGHTAQETVIYLSSKRHERPKATCDAERDWSDLSAEFDPVQPGEKR